MYPNVSDHGQELLQIELDDSFRRTCVLPTLRADMFCLALHFGTCAPFRSEVPK